jgi:XTP/dITP diphosphohydrolase
LRPIFASRGIGVVDLREIGLQETPEEDDLEASPTFEENALAKARWFFQRSGIATVADDSGLVVRALDGRPGVHSKRWSGRNDLTGQALDDENNRLLLSALAHSNDRSASYVCVAAYVDGTAEFVSRGEVHGRIAPIGRGSRGFGYDPYFIADELGRTFGEATREAKELISHRGRAFRALISTLESYWIDRATS